MTKNLDSPFYDKAQSFKEPVVLLKNGPFNQDLAAQVAEETKKICEAFKNKDKTKES